MHGKRELSSSHSHKVEGLASEDLAALVVDSLLRAGIIKASDVKRAIAIAKEEFEVRKALGDY